MIPKAKALDHLAVAVWLGAPLFSNIHDLLKATLLIGGAAPMALRLTLPHPTLLCRIWAQVAIRTDAAIWGL